MRLLTIISCFFFLLSSCDPYQMVYIKNYSALEIKVDVHLSNRYPHTQTIFINSIDTLIEDRKAIFDIKFNEKIRIENFNDTLYQAILPPRSSSLLEPICMGFPISRIFITSDIGMDSIIFYDSNHNIKQLKKKKMIQKASLSTFIIDFGK